MEGDMTTETITEFQAYNLTKSGTKLTVYGATPREAAAKLLLEMKAARSRSKEMRVNQGEREGPFFVHRMAISTYSTNCHRSWKLPATSDAINLLPEA
jgi:hypothetical protein